MILVREIRKRYGRIAAADGVSFEIGKGETFGLLGPNGAGKTTTISIISGIVHPDGGEVLVNGSPDPTRAHVRTRLGIAPQALALYEELTAEQNLAFFGSLYGFQGKGLRERVDRSLGVAGLSDRRRSRVETYSGGMKRRLNLACALMHDPQALLLDEPTVGVDPQSRNQIFETIETLKGEGRTILYTTHYMEEAERLCDRVAIMDAGRILDMGSVRELVARHGGEATVEARLAGGVDAEGPMPGPVRDGWMRFATAEPAGALARLHEQGLRFDDLVVRKPTLEDVFLHLTGRSLRDE